MQSLILSREETIKKSAQVCAAMVRAIELGKPDPSFIVVDGNRQLAPYVAMLLQERRRHGRELEVGECSSKRLMTIHDGQCQIFLTDEEQYTHALLLKEELQMLRDLPDVTQDTLIDVEVLTHLKDCAFELMATAKAAGFVINLSMPSTQQKETFQTVEALVIAPDGRPGKTYVYPNDGPYGDQCKIK